MMKKSIRTELAVMLDIDKEIPNASIGPKR